MKTLNNTLSFLSLFFFFFLTVSTSTASQIESITGDILCGLVGCGQGTCNGSTDNAPFFFDCDCFPGWTKLKIGDVVFPPCILPNCTINFDCGLPPLSLPTNFSDPCDIIWCGDGTCKLTNKSGHACVCNKGAFNLNNSADMPCFKDCALGANCVNVGLNTPPPALVRPPAPTPSKGSNGGKGSVPVMKNGGPDLGVLPFITALMMLLIA
ncbi:hypothetical protein DsansV1_C42g0238251 [Dioscorea sansibarensis]